MTELRNLFEAELLSSTKAFLSQTKQIALTSEAVTHPYLDALEQGLFADNSAAFRDFADQYGAYSSKFSSYVSSVISLLSDQKHKDILIENLKEEQGSCHDVELPPNVLSTVVDQPHSLLFARFQKALGVKSLENEDRTENEPGLKWGNEFAALCSMNEYVGVGAIGFGTELIVSRIYKKILSGLRLHTQLTPIEHVFFDLHSECDDEHAEQILFICGDLATDQVKREQIEFGAKKALELRVEFWEAMFKRARSLNSDHRSFNRG